MERAPPSPDRGVTAEPAGRTLERIRDHLDQGAPWDACDAFRDAIARRPGDAELLYWGALAHARAGAMHVAHSLLDAAETAVAQAPARRADILSLRGHLWKEAFHRAPEHAGSMRHLERAREQYAKAYAIAHDPYPGINAATLSMLLGDRAPAARIAGEIAARLAARTTPPTVWDLATDGEARLVSGDFDGAARSYDAAWRTAAGNAGIVATMRRQLSLLARVVPRAADLLRLLRVCDVVAFAGHLVDAPDRPVARFPAALVPAVHAALRERLACLHQPIVFTSGACGADLLFVDAALELGAEVNIVLPFDKRDFVRTSVAIGGDEWLPRFEAALARATRVIMATEEGYLGDDVLFEHAAVLVEGFSMLRAAQLQTSPTLLCVVDPGEAGKVGGTRATLERWTRNAGPSVTIDLRDLRARNPADAGGTEGEARQRLQLPDPATQSAAAPAAAAGVAPRPQRTLKTMLFADFAGYSRLPDAYAPLFQHRFLEIGAALIEASPGKPLEAKTWGDALYAVFASTCDGAEFALRFLEAMLRVDWTAAGLSETSQVRIALHAGPVFCGHDPITGRDSYFGSSVTRAARIEPVTPPGMVYASEAFAAILASTGQRDYALEYMGKLALAKGYGESRIYRLARR
ncbi:MAG TPA: adenylate/guanylate cyclase domain-containing protein [Casimicrobiaceae bacterium]